MEGSVSEEQKSVQRGADGQGASERNRVKRKRAPKKRSSRVQRRTDASQSGSEHHQVKRKRVKKEFFSWFQTRRFQTRTDASQGGSERHQVKRKKVKKELVWWSKERLQAMRRKVDKEHAEREQRGTDAFQGGSEYLQPKRRGVDKEHAERLQSTIDAIATQQQIDGGSDRGRLKREEKSKQLLSNPRLAAILKGVVLRRAKMALELYEKSQDAEFEILEVLNYWGSELELPESECSNFWLHISFTAKCKNPDCSDVSPKHFFAELVVDERSGNFNAKYCSTFEPSDDPGFDHGCIFCPAGEIHPGADGYRVGRPPWYIPEDLWAGRY